MTRIPAELSNHDRAVTAGDFAQLASIQGVGRAECLPHFYPPTLDQQAAGSRHASWSGRAPTPCTPTRRRPTGRCCPRCAPSSIPRRLVTTELYVVPPTYHQIAVSVGVHAQPGYSGNAVCNWVETVLRQYLSPMPPYGPAGGGWPLGRQVFGPGADGRRAAGRGHRLPGAGAARRARRQRQLAGRRPVAAHRPSSPGRSSSSRPSRSSPARRWPRARPFPRRRRRARCCRSPSRWTSADMAPARSLATVCTTDQWLRCGHQDTALDLSAGTVSLAWQQPAAAVWTGIGRRRPGRAGLRPRRLPLPRRPGHRPGAVDRLAARRPARRCAVSSPRRSTCSPTRAAAAVRPVPGGLGPAPPGPGPVVDRGRPRPAPVRPRRRDRHDLGLRPRRPRRVPARLARPRPATGLAGAGTAVLVAVADRGLPLCGSKRAASRSPSRCPPPRWRASTRTRSRSRSRAAAPTRSGCCGGRRTASSWAVPAADERGLRAARPVLVGQRHRARRRRATW